MTRTVTRATLTTAVVILFVTGLGQVTVRDMIVSAVLLYPFAHLLCKHVIRN